MKLPIKPQTLAATAMVAIGDAGILIVGIHKRELATQSEIERLVDALTEAKAAAVELQNRLRHQKPSV